MSARPSFSGIPQHLVCQILVYACSAADGGASVARTRASCRRLRTIVEKGIVHRDVRDLVRSNAYARRVCRALRTGGAALQANASKGAALQEVFSLHRPTGLVHELFHCICVLLGGGSDRPPQLPAVGGCFMEWKTIVKICHYAFSASARPERRSRSARDASSTVSPRVSPAYAKRGLRQGGAQAVLRFVVLRVADGDRDIIRRCERVAERIRRNDKVKPRLGAHGAGEGTGRGMGRSFLMRSGSMCGVA